MDMFEGPEAEGHLKGLQTLFIREGQVDLEHAWPHLFFTKEYNDYDHIREHIEYDNTLITVECFDHTLASIPRDIINRAHILVRVPLLALDHLKETDSIVVGVDFECVTFQVGTGIKSVPQDYQWDRKR